jgi:hypothetical protein
MNIPALNAAEAAQANFHANDISPDLKAGQALRAAEEELKKCQKLFDGWAVELEKYVHVSCVWILSDVC